MFLGRLLLGGLSPLFDQLQQCLAAAAQTLALLELVKHGNGFAGQCGDELLHATGGKPLPVGAIFVETWLLRSACMPSLHVASHS